MKLLCTTFFIFVFVGLLYSAQVQAKGVVCEHIQADVIEVDGYLDDWELFKGTRYGSGQNSQMSLRCAYDQHSMYFSLRIIDDRLLRTPKALVKSEDHLRFEIGVGKHAPLGFTVFPGSRRAPRKSVRLPSYVVLEDSLQDNGFSIEFSIPLRKFKSWASSVPYLNGKILYYDVDSRGGKGKKIGLRGKVHFSDAAATYRAFMKAARLRNSDIRLDRLVDVDPGAGPERVLVGGTIIGVVGESFNFMQLPIAGAKDMLRAKVVNFDGSGRYAIVTELRQYGNGGSRDIVVVWFAQGNGRFQQALTIETRKKRDGMYIENDWAIVPKRGSKGMNLIVKAGQVEGFSADNYREAPAPDAKAIVLPWSERLEVLYYFEGSTAYEGEVLEKKEATPKHKKRKKKNRTRKRR